MTTVPEAETPAANDNATVEIASSAKTPKAFISSNDLAKVVEILSKADNISLDEAVRRLNSMCDKGLLTIVPAMA